MRAAVAVSIDLLALADNQQRNDCFAVSNVETPCAAIFNVCQAANTPLVVSDNRHPLFTNMNNDMPRTATVTVLPEINALPGAKSQATIDDRDAE